VLWLAVAVTCDNRSRGLLLIYGNACALCLLTCKLEAVAGGRLPILRTERTAELLCAILPQRCPLLSNKQKHYWPQWGQKCVIMSAVLWWS